MSDRSYSGPTEPAESDTAASTFTRFFGTIRNAVSLVAKGSLLMLVTFGIYRFWYITDLRRFYWNNTSLSQSHFEYTGRATELLIGFLIALAVFIPLQVAYFIATLNPNILQLLISVVLYLAVFIILAHYASFRARRYRLSRTIWQGLRFHQTGSPWSYAFRAFGWWLVSLLTLGLAYPWMAASLARFKAVNTWYGDLQATYSTTARPFIGPYFLFWFLLVAPIVLICVYVYLSVASGTFIDMQLLISWLMGESWLTGEGGEIDPAMKDELIVAMLMTCAFIWLFAGPLMLLPYLRAREFRIFTTGYAFGDVKLVSYFKARSEYRIHGLYYLVFIGVIAVFVYVFLQIVDDGFMARLLSPDLESVPVEMPQEQAGYSPYLRPSDMMLGIAFYLVMIIVLTACKELLFKLPLWKRRVQSLQVHNLAALEAMHAQTKEGGAFGEGLADAFDVDFGF